MQAQSLDRTLTCFRIGDPNGEYPIFESTGSIHSPGRWNTPSSPMIYAALHYSTALLEKLVRGSGRLPPNQHYVTITIPRGAPYEVFEPTRLNGWDGPDQTAAQSFGQAWHVERRSLFMLVPSVVARLDDNVLINPYHPAFVTIEHSLHKPVPWDRRLFS